jgi:hypothetical protein
VLSRRLVFCQAEIMMNMSSTPTPGKKRKEMEFSNILIYIN